MASPAAFKERIASAKRNADIRDVLESTGAQPTNSNTAKGEYTYNAPYREDVDPSLVINTQKQTFCDYGMTDAYGDVIALTRLIIGQGDLNAVRFMEAIEWLENFAGGARVAPAAIKQPQPQKKAPSVVNFDGERFALVKATPFTAKTNVNYLDYVQRLRGIGLAVAKQYLSVIQYKDSAAAFDDPYRGLRYGIGSRNDLGGYEVRAATPNSSFKTSLGGKGITTHTGRADATTGDVFESQWDFYTSLEIAGLVVPVRPTIILNSGRFAAIAGAAIAGREDWQQVRDWRVWQHADDEGHRSTLALIEAMGDGYTVGTLEHYWQGHNDLNECWTKAPDAQRQEMVRGLTGGAPAARKSYDTSASAEMRRANDEKLKNIAPKFF